MRPRSVDRGERRFRIGHVEVARLQCGHGRLTVENATYSPALALAYKELQCGHGRLTVENVRPADEPRGVAALQCGHGRLTVENPPASTTSSVVTELQCGHGRLTVENLAAKTTLIECEKASMRPRSVDRGELQVRGCVARLGRAPGFNAATVG